MARSKPELGDLNQMIGVELRIAQILADRLFASCDSLRMAPGHFTVLSIIDLNPGINQSQLARSMYLDRSSMVPILDQLQKKSWIERRRPPNDRRAHALFLTNSGTEALREAGEEVKELEAAIEGEMGRKQRATLLALIKQFQSALLRLQQTDSFQEAANDSKN